MRRENQAERELKSRLKGLGRAFAKDELAYLALTARVEAPIRDRLAVCLQRRLPSRFCVARECPKRTDLAIFESTDGEGTLPRLQPIVLIELKAMYSYDVLYTTCPTTGFERHYLPNLTADLRKAQLLANAGASVYGLLLATHPDQGIPAEFTRVVKNYSPITKAYTRRNHTSTSLWKAMHEYVAPRIEKLGSVTTGAWDAGNAFGVHVRMAYWLVRSGRGG